MAGEHFLSASLIKSSDIGSGSWVAVASTDAVDRDFEVLDAHWASPLPDRVPVHWEHSGPLIGSARPYYRGADLMVDGVFASTEKGQEARSLVKEGHLSRMSVCFFNAKSRLVDGVKHIVSGELLSIDLVSVPSNRQAAVLSARSFDSGRETSLAKSARKAVIDTLLTMAALDLDAVREMDSRRTDWRKDLVAAEDALFIDDVDALLRRVDRMTRGKR